MNTARLIQKKIMANGFFYAMALVMAFGLKMHYSRAGADALVWILAPTAALTEVITGDVYQREENCGFVSRERGIIIAPACAGVNFLIIAFCMAVFSFIHVFRRAGLKFGWFLAGAAAAYGMAVIVNAVRISISTVLLDADIYSGWITYERVHRFEGVAVYFLFLWLFYAVIRRIAVHGETNPDRHFRSVTVPLFSYLAVAVGIPIANFAFRRDPALFLEHCLSVIAISAGLCLVLASCRAILHFPFRYSIFRVMLFIRQSSHLIPRNAEFPRSDLHIDLAPLFIFCVNGFADPGLFFPFPEFSGSEFEIAVCRTFPFGFVFLPQHNMINLRRGLVVHAVEDHDSPIRIKERERND